MNNLEKRSFYSFLSLYIGSSFLFLALAGFWYYTAQKNALQNNSYFQMQHYSDKVSAAIINAHMQGGSLHLPAAAPQTELTLISTQNDVVYGALPHEISILKNNFSILENRSILISDTPQEHLNIKYVIVQSSIFHQELEALLAHVLLVMIVIALGIVSVAWVLSKIFMRPIRQKVEQIEQFVQDISHELNTPITALKMSAKRAMQKGVYDEKILTNISISTKQLYSIYQSLAYLNFSTPKQQPETIDLQPILEESIAYYAELSRAKNISFDTAISSASLLITEERAKLLFSNLISNAIKYSMPNTTITVTLKEHVFSIQDEGVGIAEEKIKEIFKPYERGSHIAGGFGIGLSIVKQICDEFKININVESEIDKGSCFTLTWS
ncbi:MAG: HAMP domain-containing sensor histidine kinase [Helicobacteraceae bacterium]|jgi:two-component system OmpR family sensor kinase|nr:HAMP domain-containing sensor histidine kinase [Helicobacteraceae bacterium]